MYLLAEILPWVRKLRIKFSRDQAVMFLTAAMLVLVGLDIYFAHLLDAVIKPYEWIPIIFSPIAGIALFIAGWISLKKRFLANWIATIVLFLCVVVGVLGSYFHLRWTVMPDAPLGSQITMNMMIFGPPLLGPLTFILIAIMGLSGVWEESPVDSGRLLVAKGKAIQMPTSKTQAYLLITGIFLLATVLSSVLDHARVNFENPWLWLPTLAGVFSTVVAVIAGMMKKLKPEEIWIYLGAMLLMMLVGLIGFILHVQNNLVRENIFVFERFIRGAPFMAPLLFANMGMLGILVMLNPKVE